MKLSSGPMLCALLISACAAGLSNVRYSKPAVEAKDIATVEERYVGEMYVIGDVAFHVYPGNSKSKEFMILPFPFPFAENPTNKPPFVVGVALKTAKAGYTFSPTAVGFWEDSSNHIRPTRLQGPFGCSSQEPRPAWSPVAETLVVLLPNACSFMWVEFNTIPPDPSETFFVELAGLRFAGANVALPVIRFQVAERTETFAVP